MAKNNRTKQIEIPMIAGYGDRQRSQQYVCYFFTTVLDRKSIVQSTVSRLVKKFKETDTKAIARCGRPKSAKKGQALEVLVSLIDNSTTSSWQLTFDYCYVIT